MKSYISRKFPPETMNTALSFSLRSISPRRRLAIGLDAEGIETSPAGGETERLLFTSTCIVVPAKDDDRALQSARQRVDVGGWPEAIMLPSPARVLQFVSAAPWILCSRIIEVLPCGDRSACLTVAVRSCSPPRWSSGWSRIVPVLPRSRPPAHLRVRIATGLPGMTVQATRRSPGQSLPAEVLPEMRFEFVETDGWSPMLSSFESAMRNLAWPLRTSLIWASTGAPELGKRADRI